MPARKSTSDRPVSLRIRLLREATEILVRDGFDGLTVRRVAEAAGCSTIGIYTHFNGKQGLVEAALVDAYDDFETALAQADALPPGRGQLVASGQTYREWALGNRSRYLVMFGSYLPEFTASPQATERMHRSLRVQTERVAAAIAVGDLAPGEASDIAYYLWASVHGYVMLELFYLDEDADARRPDFDLNLERLLDGITPR